VNRIGLDAGLIPPLRESVSTIMLSVILALMPGTLLYIGFINSQMAINVLIACTTALLIEALMLRLRRRSMAALTDGSIIVAAWLLALCLPPTLPAWQLIVGVSVMTTLGKHVFGGLGHNPFNPAMVAYAFLIISFPGSMTNWELQSGFFSPASNNISTRTTDKAIEVEQAIDFSSTDSMAEDASTTQWDSITRATPLDRLRQLRHESRRQDSGELPVDDQRESQPGNVAAGKALIALNIAWLLGGLFLLYRRIISWHIPVSVLGSVLAIYSIYALWTPAFVLGPISALFSGAIIFGAFFIATDPVSCATRVQCIPRRVCIRSIVDEYLRTID